MILYLGVKGLVLKKRTELIFYKTFPLIETIHTQIMGNQKLTIFQRDNLKEDNQHYKNNE